MPFRRRITVSLATALVALLVACNTSSPEVHKRGPIRLGSYAWAGNYWIEVAWQKGWFAAAGLDVERVDMNMKYFESLDRLTAGKLDMVAFTQFDLVRYVAAGHDLVGVAATDYSDGAEALVARPGINAARELRGKRVALHRGSYLEYLLDVFAEREGLHLDELTLVDTLDDAAAGPDLQAGKIDAAFLWEPYLTEAQQSVGGTRLFSTAELPGLTYSVLTLRRDFLRERPDDVAALLRVWERAVRFIREHPDETCEIVASLYQVPLENVRALLRSDRILDLADNSRAFSYGAGFESLHASWRRMNDFMIERGLVTRRVDSPDHLDSRFIHALD